MFYYVKEIGGKEVRDVRWENLEKAISSMRYLSETNGKKYEVLAVVYTTDDAREKDYGNFLQEQMDKYGND